MHGLGAKWTCAQIPDYPGTSYVASGKLPNLSEPQFICKMEDRSGSGVRVEPEDLAQAQPGCQLATG